MAQKRQGLVTGMPAHEYHSGPEASYSSLKRVWESPGKWRWFRDHPEPRSQAMIIGSAVDCLLFDGPKDFAVDYVAPPLTPDDLPGWCKLAPNGTRKADKAVWDEIKAEGLVPIKPRDFDFDGLKLNTKSGRGWREYNRRYGVTILTHKEVRQVEETVRAVLAYPLAGPLLDGATYQASLFWKDLETGFPCRSRPDIMSRNLGWIDLKTSASAALHDFNRTITKLRYQWQAAMALDAARILDLDIPEEWYWIVVEPTPPYRVEVSDPAPLSLIEVGRDEYLCALRKFKLCYERDYWPVSSGVPQPYDLQEWKYR